MRIVGLLKARTEEMRARVVYCTAELSGKWHGLPCSMHKLVNHGIDARHDSFFGNALLICSPKIGPPAGESAQFAPLFCVFYPLLVGVRAAESRQL